MWRDVLSWASARGVRDSAVNLASVSAFYWNPESRKNRVLETYFIQIQTFQGGLTSGYLAIFRVSQRTFGYCCRSGRYTMMIRGETVLTKTKYKVRVR